MASKQNKNESVIVSETCDYMANYVKERSDEGYANYLVFNLNNDDIEDEIFEALRVDGDAEGGILDVAELNRRIFENYADYCDYAWWENETDALEYFTSNHADELLDQLYEDCEEDYISRVSVQAFCDERTDEVIDYLIHNYEEKVAERFNLEAVSTPTMTADALTDTEKRLTEAEMTLKKAQEEIEQLKAENQKIREQNDRFFAKIQKQQKDCEELALLKTIFRGLVRDDVSLELVRED